jgi:hypothetical protein
MNYLFIGFAALLLIWFLGSYIVIRNIEEPSYVLLEKKDGYEIRQYDSYIIAETEVDGEYREAMGQGFRVIADYIFGNNTSKTSISMTVPVLEGVSEKIEMTAPVINTMSIDKKRKVSFVLPSKYTLETLPQPNNSTVNLREVESKKVAVRRFSWYATEKRISNQKAILEEKLIKDNVSMIDTMQVAQYNPPLSFPFTLRNEIIVDIK